MAEKPTLYVCHGDDGGPLTDYDLIGSAERGTGLFALRAVDDLHFLCVGTPQQASGNAADLAQVHEAVAALAAHLTRRCLLVGKSG